MPMIDVYAAAGTFPDPHALARDLAAAVMRWEQVPDLPLFANNTAAFVHDMDAAAISNVAGESNYVRVQMLTPAGVLDRDKQLGVVKELTEIVAAAAGDSEPPRAHLGPAYRVAGGRLGDRRSREHECRHCDVSAGRARRPIGA